jgi:hypothetical protein
VFAPPSRAHTTDLLSFILLIFEICGIIILNKLIYTHYK